MARTKTSLHAMSGGLGDKPRSPRQGEISSVSIADRQVSKAARSAMKDVVIEPDYTLSWQVAALCPLIIGYHPSK